MLLWNYILCIRTDPGHVPDNWAPDTHAEGYEVKKLTGKPRYCRMCEKPKPPRAHHCRSCKRCVLRMDHHCPWINNCVGHFNYGHFIRFLFYVDLACSYHLAMISTRLYKSLTPQSWHEMPSHIELVFLVLNYVACVPVLMLVGGFSLYHFYLLGGNCTTIEGWEKDKVATMVRRGKIRAIKFPYNLGFRRNIEAVLGPNIWLWCCPTRTPGTGLKYQLADGDDAEMPWPPQDPDLNTQNKLMLPDSPWTYDNESVNPLLQPSNSQLREAAVRRRRSRQQGVSAVAPYHPDYKGEEDGYSSSTSFDEQPRIRRGSEGYEVRPVNREEMLQQYVHVLDEEPGKYIRYIPEPDTDSESEDGLPFSQYPTDTPNSTQSR
ncbi:hypothetical protein M378DRAFT_19864 [Amanita muscaria Koide BX008]|uniref:Palmitoyltransferase n=1 Tax=Amanita muscaria (strain Koide BX008) TaxID=946122 RepID=A0A0C2XPN2_AMAMK|nr:hypothetical protein M378DRAFT_19864 [Amanita muscaria Koide BX008]